MNKTPEEVRVWAVLREEIGGRAALALRDENRTEFKAQFLRARVMEAVSEAASRAVRVLGQ